MGQTDVVPHEVVEEDVVVKPVDPIVLERLRSKILYDFREKMKDIANDDQLFEFFNYVLSKLGTALPNAHVFIGQPSEDFNSLTFTYATPNCSDIVLHKTLSKQAVTFRVLESGHPEFIPDVSQEQDITYFNGNNNYNGSMFIAPLLNLSNQVVNSFTVDYSHVKQITDHEEFNFIQNLIEILQQAGYNVDLNLAKEELTYATHVMFHKHIKYIMLKAIARILSWIKGGEKCFGSVLVDPITLKCEAVMDAEIAESIQ